MLAELMKAAQDKGWSCERFSGMFPMLDAEEIQVLWDKVVELFENDAPKSP